MTKVAACGIVANGKLGRVREIPHYVIAQFYVVLKSPSE